MKTPRLGRLVTSPIPLDTEPIVGSYYAVPCVFVHGDRRWWPVLGSAHSDPELGADYEHYHFDARFISDPDMRKHDALRPEFLLNRVQPVNPSDPALPENWIRPGCPPIEPPVLRRKRCWRRMPEHIAHNYSPFALLEASFLDVTLPDCRRCPHRGIPLTNLPVDEAGCVVCPGHGLKWNLASGRLVPHGTREEKR